MKNNIVTDAIEVLGGVFERALGNILGIEDKKPCKSKCSGNDKPLADANLYIEPTKTKKRKK
tara:strand:- start:37 stop:222 length:186 start_codon:yes stop_codon:yes gene_type:complete